ncbi:hypothetical protein J6590_023218 [Homalodisca vitripennis]|nr:hypothetical protein J6590_023218 [Homalodisca vitripennis]
MQDNCVLDYEARPNADVVDTQVVIVYSSEVDILLANKSIEATPNQVVPEWLYILQLSQLRDINLEDLAEKSVFI